MSDCDSNCKTCKTGCPVCPVCGKRGLKVPMETIRSLSKVLVPDFVEDGYICINRKCAVIYFFRDTPTYLSKDDVKSKIWFKSGFNEYLVCYCHNIFLKDVVEFVKKENKPGITKDYYFKAHNLTEGDCLHHFPLGCSCDKNFKAAIDFAYSQLNNDEKNKN